MSFKRKNSKPIRVPDTVPYETHNRLTSFADGADGILCNGVTPFSSPNLNQAKTAIPLCLGVPPLKSDNEPVSCGMFDVEHESAQWHLSLSLPSHSCDLPTMVSPNGLATTKWTSTQKSFDSVGLNARPSDLHVSNCSSSGLLTRHTENQELQTNNKCPPKKTRKIKFKYQDQLAMDVKYKCTVCEYRTKRSDHYKRHLLIHSEEKPLKCATCGYGTGRSDHFRRHLVRHGLNEEEIIAQCARNGIRTTTPTARTDCRTPRSRSSNEVEHGPVQSQRTSRTPSPIGSGAQAEDGADASKRFNCDVCGYCTDRCSHYTRHLRTHSDDKPYDCPKCGRRFKLETYLKKHRCSVRHAPLQSAPASNAVPDSSLFDSTADLLTLRSDCLDNSDIDPVHAGCGIWSSHFTDPTSNMCSNLLET